MYKSFSLIVACLFLFSGCSKTELSNKFLGIASTQDELNKVENKFDHTISWIKIQSDFDQPFPKRLATKLLNSETFIAIDWQPWVFRQKNSIQLKDIIDGKWDAYLNSWISDIKSHQYPVMINFSPFINNQLAPWTVTNTTQYTKAYQYIMTLFKKNNVNNVVWSISISMLNVPKFKSNTIEFYLNNLEDIQIIDISTNESYLTPKYKDQYTYEHIQPLLTNLKTKYPEKKLALTLQVNPKNKLNENLLKRFSLLANSYFNLIDLFFFHTPSVDQTFEFISSINKKFDNADQFLTFLETSAPNEQTHKNQPNITFQTNPSQIIKGLEYWDDNNDFNAHYSINNTENEVILTAQIFDELPLNNEHIDAAILKGDSIYFEINNTRYAIKLSNRPEVYDLDSFEQLINTVIITSNETSYSVKTSFPKPKGNLHTIKIQFHDADKSKNTETVFNHVIKY